MNGKSFAGKLSYLFIDCLKLELVCFGREDCISLIKLIFLVWGKKELYNSVVKVFLVFLKKN